MVLAQNRSTRNRPTQVAAQPAGRTRRPPVRLNLARIVQLALLLLASVAFLYPFVWLVSASLKPRTEVFDNSLLPHHWRWANYSDLWHYAPVLQWILNSVEVALAAAVTVTLSSALVAFGFAYYRFRFRSAVFGLVLATMMLPGAVTMIPVYLLWHRVGLTGTQVPLWAQNLFGSAFYIFLLRQFFLTIPRDYFEAARSTAAASSACSGGSHCRWPGRP